MFLSIYVSGNIPDARLAESLLATQAFLCAHAQQSSFVILISIIKIDIYLLCGPKEIGAEVSQLFLRLVIKSKKKFKFCNITYRTHIMYIVSPMMLIQPSHMLMIDFI